MPDTRRLIQLVCANCKQVFVTCQPAKLGAVGVEVQKQLLETDLIAVGGALHSDDT